jgi:hypothetical protein
MFKMLCVIVCCVGFFVTPQLSYSQKSIGEITVKEKEITSSSLDIPIEKWVGRKFIFLGTDKGLRRFGYDFKIISSDKMIDRSKLEDILGNLKYDKFYGKIITAEKVEKNGDWYVVIFVLDKPQMRISAKCLLKHGNIRGIALVDDLERAKEKWLGKSIYSKRPYINTYSEEQGKYGKVKVTIDEPLKVIDVWWGFSEIRPIWLIVETPRGEKGIIDIAFSWTNIYKDWWEEDRPIWLIGVNRPWEVKLFESNPRETYNWNKEIWESINNEKVKIGMKKIQVQLSWGYPQKINKELSSGSIREQWVYEDQKQYVYFENDVVTGIQSH